MGCDLVKIRDELLGELYSSGATPKAIEIAKLQIESEIYNIRMTSKKVKNTEEFNTEDYDSFYDLYETEYNYSMSDITNHSGGANGADILWDKTGSKYGMTKNNHYYMGEKSKTNAPHGNVEISKDEISEGQVEAAKAASRNYGYSLPKMKDERITRNWVQVKNSNQIVAISLIADSGEKLMPDQASDTRTANLPSVTGGTGYAVSMGINHKKEIYVYNQKDNASGKYPQGWYKYDYGINDFVKSEIPVLSKNFAGIGSRNLLDSGKKAIEDVYKNTSEKLSTDTEIIENNSVEIFNGRWRRDEVSKDTDRIYLFGENEKRTSGSNVDNGVSYPNSTQAVIRGLKNTYGIITKKDQYENKDSYYTEKDKDKYFKYLDNVFKILNDRKSKGEKFVISSDGIGTGKAKLPDSLYNELAKRINSFAEKEIMEYKNSGSENAYEIRPGVFTNKNQTKAINEIKDFYNDNSKTSFLVKGRGGTGKTTIIGKAIEEIISSSNGKIKEEDVAFITPSHKTVGVLQSSLSGTKFQKNDVKTIDSALGFTLDKEKDAFTQTDESRQNIKNFAYHPNKDSKFYPKIVIIDEASMVSSEKYNALIETAKKTGVNMKLIFMGDNVQHAPVNDIVNGKVLRESYVFDQVKDQAILTERMRQGEESPIVPITDLIANEIEKPNYSGKFENINFDGIDKLNSDKTEGVEYSTVAEKSNTFKKFIEDFKKNPNGTRWIHFNNSFNKNTHILIPEIRESVFGKENASSNEFLKGEQITLISNLQIDLNPNKIITFNKESPFVIKSIDKELHNEDFSYIDYKFGRVNGVFPKATISLPVITGTISDGMFDHNRIRLVTKEGLAILKSKGLSSTDKLTDMRVGSFAYDYVINTHRAQGSTYDTVYVDYENIIENVSKTKDEDAALKSLYVAVSRPKKKLVIQGYDAGKKANVFKNNNTLNINFGTKENKELSNLAYRPFTFKGKKFVSVEHAYQTLKSEEFDEEIYNNSRWNNVVNGETVKIKSNKKKPKIKNNWNVDVLMKTLMIVSFNQNENARRILVNTGNAKLSHTQGDKTWSKEFPRLLTEIREKYNENKSSEPEVTVTSGSENTTSTDGIISGSGPKEWRINEDSDMLMMDMGFDNITTFIDKLVGLTGDMSKRSNNASYHTQLKSIIDNIKNMMNEYKFDKQIRVVLLNTEDTFTNATFESYPEVTMIEDKDGIPRLYSGMLTLRYGKDYDSKKRQNIRTDENGNQTSEVLDSYENAMSGFRELVLHEMLHAMIDEAMRYDNDLYAKAKAIQKRFAGKVTAESMTEAMKEISGFEATADHYTQMNDIVKYINGSPVEFLTYALTNPMVYEILDKASGSANMELITTIKRDPTVKKSVFATIIDMLIKTINSVYSITKIGKGKPLDTLNNIVLNAMAKGIVTAGLNDADKQREIQGSKYESYNLGEGILNVSANYRKYEDKIKEFNAKTFDKAMAKDGRIKLGSRIEAAARWMNKFEFIKDNKEKGRFRLFSDIANTVLEDTTSKDGGAADFYKLFREIKGNRDRDKVGMTQVARNYLDELWKDQEPGVRNSMTYMLQADWKGLGLSLEEYGTIVANDEMITKEIEALKSKIKAVEYINGAKDLGYYIVHGVSKSPELMRNAKMIYNRAYDIKRKPLVQYSEPEAVADIDKLASLYALRFMDKSTRVDLAKVINSDIELVEATSNMYYTYYEGQAKKFIATGLDKYLEKGGMRKNTQVPKNFEVLPEDKIRKSKLFSHTKIRIDEATTEAMNDGKTYWLVVSDDYGVSRTQGGFDDIHIIDKGMGLRNIREDAMDLSSMHEMIDSRSRKAPYYLNKTSGDTLAEMNQLPSQLVPAFDIYGNVIDYEIPISEYDRKQVGMINDIAETLSRTISHINSKENAVGNNVKFAQMLIKDSTENAGKPGYVLLRPSTIDEIASGTRHRYDEEWAMIPNYIQRMIISRDENGLAVRDGLWVKEGRINNIIGYKDASIVNMKLFGKDKPMLENHPEVKRALQVLEYYWKQIAGRYKEIVVKLFPNVVYGNFTSNMWVAMRHGIGPMEYAKAFKRHWSGLTDYLEMSEELTKLKLMQDAGKIGLDSQIKELEDRMSLNSFDKLIKDGQFSTILEDLDLTGLTGKSHLADIIDEKVAKGGKIAEKAKSIVDELYINRNTQSHKVIEKLTVFNDIINRSIITERLTQDLDSISFADKAMKDEKIQDILNYVDMLFVNYSYLDNKYVKYVNDTNIVLFTKYFFRALKANLAMMTRNPLSSLGFEGIDTFVMDLSDSFDQYGSPIDTIARKIFPNPIDMLGDLLVPNIANPIIEGR